MPLSRTQLGIENLAVLYGGDMSRLLIILLIYQVSVAANALPCNVNIVIDPHTKDTAAADVLRCLFRENAQLRSAIDNFRDRGAAPEEMCDATVTPHVDHPDSVKAKLKCFVDENTQLKLYLDQLTLKASVQKVAQPTNLSEKSGVSTGVAKPAVQGAKNGVNKKQRVNDATVLVKAKLDKKFFFPRKHSPIFEVGTDQDCFLNVDGKDYGLLKKFQFDKDNKITLEALANEDHVYLFMCRALGSRNSQSIKVGLQNDGLINFTLRYRLVGGDTLLDLQTGRGWTERSNGADINFDQALTYCKSLGGKWHLPTHEEFLSLNLGSTGPFGKRCNTHYTYMDGACPEFDQSDQNGVYWSDFSQGDKGLAFYSNFAGWDLKLKSDAKGMRVICVK
jgi:hypothetical protein